MRPYLKIILLFITGIAASNHLVYGNNPKIEQHLLYSKKTDQGNDLNFNPLSVYFNTAFDTIQNPNYFTQKNFFKNHKVVFNRIKDPIKGIKEGGGTKRFLIDEFFSARALPNFGLHLIGSGYDYRKLAEWFDLNGYNSPYLYSFLLIYLAEFGNEAIESSNLDDIGPHDHIADLLIFDILGKFLFMNDDTVKYFKDVLGMVSWPFQPFVSLDDGLIYNAASNFILKPILKKEAKVRPFLFLGMQILMGASFYADYYTFSMGLGVAFTDPLQKKGRFTSGIFIDQDNQLLTSLILNGTSDLSFRLNIYPGIINLGNWKTGILLARSRNEQWQIGFNLNLPIGIGNAF